MPTYPVNATRKTRQSCKMKNWKTYSTRLMNVVLRNITYRTERKVLMSLRGLYGKVTIKVTIKVSHFMEVLVFLLMITN
jgi:hypothetical protein